MRYSYLFGFCLILAGCTYSSETVSTNINSQTGNTVSGTITSSGTAFTGSWQQIKTSTGETKDSELYLTKGIGAAKISYGPRSILKLNFTSVGAQSMTVDVTTPDDPEGNIRINQILFPDGSADGPFGKHLEYVLTQSGTYQIILGPDMMAGSGPWSGNVELYMELR